MLNWKFQTTSAIAILLTACGGGGGAEPVDASPVGVADTLPAYRAALQSYEARNASALAPQYLASIATVPTVNSQLATTAVTNTAAAERAMWSWYDTDVATAAKQNAMLDFAVARKVNMIFLESETLLNKPALLAAFLNRAAGRGIQVELLFGASEWVRPENHAVPLQLLERVNGFVAGLTGARPAGVHFDIEPHALPDWQTDPVTLGNQLLDLYGKLMAAKAPGLYLDADIAMGYEYVSFARGGVTRTLSQFMVDATDRTTLMDYRDYSSGQDSIESHALHPVSYAVLRGKRTTVGVETTCNVQPTKVTFCEEGRKRMDGQLADVATYFAGNRGYGGVAVHDYVNYRKLAL